MSIVPVAARPVGNDTMQPAHETTEDIEGLLAVLEANNRETRIPPPDHNENLERLRIQTTSFNASSSLFTKRGIIICCRYAFNGDSPKTSRIALRCLCNILFLAEPMRQAFVDEKHSEDAVQKMKSGDSEDEFLSARLLLLCTYGTNLDFNSLFEQDQLADIINTNLARHAKLIKSTPWDSIPATTIAACSESLKLHYNLRAFYSHKAALFSNSQDSIIQMFNHIRIPSPPLAPPLSWLINCLLHLDVEDKCDSTSDCSLLRPFGCTVDMERLVDILSRATDAYGDKELDSHGSPLVQVLLQIAERGSSTIKARLRERLLPSDKDRDSVLGKGDSLPARLLRISSALTAPNLRALVPALLFELSDKDVDQFVHNVGYGYAAGFLHTKGLQVPERALSSANVSGYGSGPGNEIGPINPVTGQRRDMEQKTSYAEMTDTEKEQEAERLFVLFERLKATGVVNVENPVAQSVREGRLEELD